MFASEVIATDGTCIQLTESPRIWAVRGRLAWYRCDADRRTCSCQSFVLSNRQAKASTGCRHLRMLTAYLIAAASLRELLASERDDAPLPSDQELKELFR